MRLPESLTVSATFERSLPTPRVQQARMLRGLSPQPILSRMPQLGNGPALGAGGENRRQTPHTTGFQNSVNGLLQNQLYGIARLAGRTDLVLTRIIHCSLGTVAGIQPKLAQAPPVRVAIRALGGSVRVRSRPLGLAAPTLEQVTKHVMLLRWRPDPQAVQLPVTLPHPLQPTPQRRQTQAPKLVRAEGVLTSSSANAAHGLRPVSVLNRLPTGLPSISVEFFGCCVQVVKRLAAESCASSTFDGGTLLQTLCVVSSPVRESRRRCWSCCRKSATHVRFVESGLGPFRQA